MDKRFQPETLLAAWPELRDEFDQPYMRELSEFLRAERRAGRPWYPAAENIFRALELVPLDEVRVVIIGQDPYHGPGQAMGLSFSVPNDLQPKPPSLTNIFKELEACYNARPLQSDLTPWSQQGCLLLNATLTVGAGRAGSHQGKGWEHFTDQVVELLNERAKHVVFLLWGRYAKQKGASIDRSRHLVLEAAHPSPLSAHNGFFGCRHFLKANEYLEAHGRSPIDWLMTGIGHWEGVDPTVRETLVDNQGGKVG